jgi:hypothetical protein
VPLSVVERPLGSEDERAGATVVGVMDHTTLMIVTMIQGNHDYFLHSFHSNGNKPVATPIHVTGLKGTFKLKDFRLKNRKIGRTSS